MDIVEKLTIFNIQRYSLHDGSGIRTVVFLKGCPLRCLWCCNPESQNPGREVIYEKSKCIGCSKCGLCKSKAPEGAVSFGTDEKAVIDFDKCKGSPDWTECCPSKALTAEGRVVSVDEILQKVEQDSVFYKHGNGGMTISGGEPLFQENSVLLLQRAKERRINTAIETCGFVPQERLLLAARYLDTIYMDIKSVNDRKHEEFTGVSAELIRDNFRALCNAFPEKPITARTPVIPGFNDSEEELRGIEEFVGQFPRVKWQRLPYHRFGVGKYEKLGRQYLLKD